MSSELAIEVQHLSKHYALYDRPHHRLLELLWGGRRNFHRPFRALDDVSFSLPRGETLGIIGRNGAGKSTLLQLICGVLTPTLGSVRIQGRIAALLELGAGFNPEFTGRENVIINSAILGLSPDQLAYRLDDMLAFADIGEFIDQPVKTYSSGMYVRLAFAVAIHVVPDILVVDEALAVGDAFFQAKCMTRLKRMMDDGVSLLFISHDIAAVKALCRHTLWLEQGRVRAFGQTSVVANQYAGDWVERINSNNATVSEDATATVDEIPSSSRSGTGAARLSDIQWSTAEGPAESFPVAYGAQLTISARLQLLMPASKIVVSYHIKDLRQQHVMGAHTGCHELIYNKDLNVGDSVFVSFRAPVLLHEGTYSLTMLVASIGDIQQYTDAVFLDWIEDAKVMRVMRRDFFPVSDLVEIENEVVVKSAAAPNSENP